MIADEQPPSKSFGSDYSSYSNMGYYGGSGKGKGQEQGQDSQKAQEECSAIMTDVLSLGFNINKEVADRLSGKFRQLIKDTQNNFDKNSKHSYEEAQKIFQKTINNPNYKLKQSDIPSIRNALSLDEMKWLEKDISHLSKVLGKIVLIENVYDFFQASIESYRQNDWRPIFDQAVSFGAGVAIGLAFSLIVPVSIPGILFIGAISALASYTLSRENI